MSETADYQCTRRYIATVLLEWQQGAKQRTQEDQIQTTAHWFQMQKKISIMGQQGQYNTKLLIQSNLSLFSIKCCYPLFSSNLQHPTILLNIPGQNFPELHMTPY